MAVAAASGRRVLSALRERRYKPRFRAKGRSKRRPYGGILLARRMGIPTHQVGDFLRDPNRQPDWAQLTRLGGDRAALLFEEFRRGLAAIDGLVEELFYDGSERGWTPRYRVGVRVLASVAIRPGALEAAVELERALAERLLASARTAKSLKEAIRLAPVSGGAIRLRVRLSTAAEVRALARVVRMKSKSAVLRRRVAADF